MSAFDVLFVSFLNVIFAIWDVEKPDETFEEIGYKGFTKIEPNNDVSIDLGKPAIDSNQEPNNSSVALVNKKKQKQVKSNNLEEPLKQFKQLPPIQSKNASAVENSSVKLLESKNEKTISQKQKEKEILKQENNDQ